MRQAEYDKNHKKCYVVLNKKDGAPKKQFKMKKQVRAGRNELQGFGIKKLLEEQKGQKQDKRVNDSKIHDHHAQVMHLTA